MNQTQLLAFYISSLICSLIQYHLEWTEKQLSTAQRCMFQKAVDGFSQIVRLPPTSPRPWHACKDWKRCYCCLGTKMWGYLSRSLPLQPPCWLCKISAVKTVPHGLCLFATKLICFLCTSLAFLTLANAHLLYRPFLSLQVRVRGQRHSEVYWQKKNICWSGWKIWMIHLL